MKTIAKIQKLLPVDSSIVNYSFNKEFNDIIINKVEVYGLPTAKESLKSFLEDMQRGGCQSGMINEFVYHASCKNFYINHIDDLEEFKTELEEQIGEPIKNAQGLPHYTFVVWLCFEEYCYEIYSKVFEQ